MAEATSFFSPSMRAMKKPAWIAAVTELLEPSGSVSLLDARHVAVFNRQGDTLLVTFETFQGIQILSPQAHPMGWELVRRKGWSHLALISDGDTWFRAPQVQDHVDRLVDAGFFDGFEQVVFYGAGPGGYAAAAYSVAAPGARVLAIQPQATLDAHLTEWDRRFPDMRRTDFTGRYGHAPQMLEAAAQAFVLYDPLQIEDAVHASLFGTPNVTRFRLHAMGSSLQTDLMRMGILVDLIAAAGDGSLTAASFARLYRARRDSLPYLRRLLTRLEADDRDALIAALRNNVAARLGIAHFSRQTADPQDD